MNNKSKKLISFPCTYKIINPQKKTADIFSSSDSESLWDTIRHFGMKKMEENPMDNLVIEIYSNKQEQLENSFEYKYIDSYRFRTQCELYSETEDRELFKTSYYKYVRSNPNPSEVFIDFSLMLATEVVISTNLLKDINILQLERDKHISETGKSSIILIEALKTSRDSYNDSITRQQKMLNHLFNN